MSGDLPSVLSQFSDALASRVAGAASLVVGVTGRHSRAISGISWQPGVVVTSEQALPDEDAFAVRLFDGSRRSARVAGRDTGTNVAALKLDAEAAASDLTAAEPRSGALALALGTGVSGPSARLTMIAEAGPAWHSMAGGRIDRLIRLDHRANRSGEGGPVIDANGGLLGMATAGPRGRALVIPHETIARVLGPLLDQGGIRRGWLGVGLQPVSVPDRLRPTSEQDAGLMVVSLAAGGPAEQAGVLPGDILLTMDGQALGHPRAIRATLGPERIGQALEIRLLRAGALQTVQVTVAVRPAA